MTLVQDALSEDDPYHQEIRHPFCIEAIVISSKVTAKAQTTVPQPVRAALDL